MGDDWPQFAPIERVFGDGPDMLQIAGSIFGDGQQFTAEWLAGVIKSDQRIEFDSATGGPTGAAAWATRSTGTGAATARSTTARSICAGGVRSTTGASGPTRSSAGAAATGRSTGWSTRGASGKSAWRSTAGTARHAAARSHAHHVGSVKGLVHVVGDHVELAFFIHVEAIVAGADPVAVIVNQGDIECQELQCPFDVQQWFDGGGQVAGRRFVENFAELDQRLPGLVIIFRFDFISAAVVFNFIADIIETAAASWTSPDLPAGAFGRGVVLGKEFLVELLQICIQPPAFAVDDDLHKVGLRCGDVLTGDVGIEDRTEK